MFKRFSYAEFGQKRQLTDFVTASCGFGRSQVDETNFRPDAEIVRASLLSAQQGSVSKGLYDFLDGVDTGFRPFRQVGADIVDIEQGIAQIKSEAKRRNDEKSNSDASSRALTDAMKAALTETFGEQSQSETE